MMMVSAPASAASIIVVFLEVGAAAAPSAAADVDGGIDGTFGDSFRDPGGDTFPAVGTVDHTTGKKEGGGREDEKHLAEEL